MSPQFCNVRGRKPELKSKTCEVVRGLWLWVYVIRSEHKQERKERAASLLEEIVPMKILVGISLA